MTEQASSLIEYVCRLSGVLILERWIQYFLRDGLEFEDHSIIL